MLKDYYFDLEKNIFESITLNNSKVLYITVDARNLFLPITLKKTLENKKLECHC